MMSTNQILALQSALIFLQMVSAAPALSPTLHMVIAASIGALQFYVQHIGNQTAPPQPDPPPAEKTKGQAA